MLGQGKADSVINLDVGARGGASPPHFGSGGFVSPKIPQPMVLSPGILVYQSQKLRDECEDIRQETSELLNQTRMLAEEARELAASAGEDAARSRSSANESMQSSIQAKSSLQETRSVYNDTSISARKMETMVKREAYAQRFDALKSAPEGGWGDLQSLQNRITALEKKVELLEQKMARLENSAAVH
jgi:predicted  nucleic acid-binding Zn-ribbon protein